MTEGFTFAQAMEALAAEFALVRERGSCLVMPPFHPGASMVHTCLRYKGHDGPHLCGCGQRWEANEP